MHRQQDILDDIVNQYAIGNLLANQHPDGRDDGPQQLRIGFAIPRLGGGH